MSERRTCRHCGRCIAINNQTGGLRVHNVPSDAPLIDASHVPGERCPGTGSTGVLIGGRTGSVGAK